MQPVVVVISKILPPGTTEIIGYESTFPVLLATL
ncbi:hypothetical protein ABID19_006778 [Mesorhizobium robiniae]|uniref:Uncharacterized protein n=1 Tax=Mesorhizobium robiniae TaxID=559315 RepID=A0ABV2GZJ9_9HYPH